MALVYIRRKKEPIEVENDRARKIKMMRFGDLNGACKLDEKELIDLGDEWAGELGQITAVEITKERPVQQERKHPADERREWEQQQLKLPVEERAKSLGFFKMAWWMRSGMTEKEPSAEILKEAYTLALDWFRKHPNSPTLDAAALEPLLEKRWGKRKGRDGLTGGLAEKMTLSPEN